MAADILIMQTDLVPVGKDQKQHLEVTRDLAIKFNNAYGECFKIPDAYIPDTVATIPGTDGQKMSKSYNNTIQLFEDLKSVKKKIMGIVTDSTPMEQPKEPEGNSIYELYKLFASPEETADMAAKFRAGNYGYGHAKKELFAAYERTFAPFRERREKLASDPDYVEDILKAGASRARVEAARTMDRVRSAVGL
jgi:tryptophanyl-tRNA synthetase